MHTLHLQSRFKFAGHRAMQLIFYPLSLFPAQLLWAVGFYLFQAFCLYLFMCIFCPISLFFSLYRAKIRCSVPLPLGKAQQNIKDLGMIRGGRSLPLQQTVSQGRKHRPLKRWIQFLVSKQCP